MKTELMDNRKPDYILLINWTHQSLSSLPVTLKAFLLFFWNETFIAWTRKLRIVCFYVCCDLEETSFFFHIKKECIVWKLLLTILFSDFVSFGFFHNWYCYLEGFRWVTLFLRRCLAERNTRAASVLSSSSSQLRPPLWQSPKIW